MTAEKLKSDGKRCKEPICFREDSCPRPTVLRIQYISESPGELVKKHTHTHTSCWAPPQSSDSVSMRISISIKFPNDANVAGKELLYGNHCTGCTDFLNRTSSWEKCNKKFTIL